MKNSYDPKKSKTRWYVLLLVCLSTFGDYYCIDNPGALHESLKTQFSHLGTSFEYYFNMLYSVYSMPNIILPFLGGIFVMKFGIRLMYFIFGMFLILGQLIFALGGTYTSMNLMLFGRIVFGFGGECLNITQSAMIVKWFNKSEIAMPLGFTITISRLGSVLNDNLSPRIASVNNCARPLWLGFIICFASFSASQILCYVDWRSDKKLKKSENNREVEIPVENNETYFDRVSDLSTMYWIITALCVTLYGCVIPFNNIASGFYTNTWFKDLPKKEASHKAGVAMSIPFFISAILVPFFGVFIDRFGNRAYLALLSSFFCLFSFSMFFYSSQLYAIILLGITYSLFASVIWPVISLVVPQEIVGFAYGLTTSVQNLGLVVLPMIVATIFSRTGDYYKTLYLFIILSFVSIALSFYLIYLDKINKNIINTNVFTEDKEEEKISLKNDELGYDSINNQVKK